MQTIPISIQTGGESIPLHISKGDTRIRLTPEQLRVVGAVSPTVDATRVDDGVEITVHDLRGTKTVELHDGEQGNPGDDYVLTEEDKDDIAGLAAEKVDLTDYVKNTDYATTSAAGVVKVNDALGFAVKGGYLMTVPADANNIKNGTNGNKTLTPSHQHEAVFYGLAKAAGVDMASSANPVGEYTDEAKAAIQTMLDVPAKADIPGVPVQDVQINGTSILDQNGVANVPVAGSGVLGAVKINNARGIGIFADGTLSMAYASSDEIKGANTSFKPITPAHEVEAAFYGLAYAAGAYDQQVSDNPVGQYTDEAKAAIRTMLGAPSLDDIPNVPVQDVQVNGQSITVNGVANVDSVIVSGTGIGSAKMRDFEYNGTTYSNEASGIASKAEGISTIASGANSHAEGNNTIASGGNAHSEGAGTTASGNNAHSEGAETTASGTRSHAEGTLTVAYGIASHAEGQETYAEGTASHAEGSGTIANANSSHVSGTYNVEDNWNLWPEWISGTSYAVGDKVKYVYKDNLHGFICKTANSDTSFSVKKWTSDASRDFVEIIGNGTADDSRSNAYALTWTGDGKYAGDVYVHANSDSTGGVKVATVNEIPTLVSQLTNDAGYLTTETDPTVPAWAKAAQKPSYTAAEVGAPTVAEMNTAIGTAIGQINSFDMAVVQALPTQDISTHTIYLVPKTGETNDVYDEYVYINNNWEMVGNTQIDLSDYATKDELPDVPVQDVQINDVSVLDAQGVAEIPNAGEDTYGLVRGSDIPVQPGTGVNSIVGKPINHNGTIYSNTASGQESVAIGLFNVASGGQSFCAGSQSSASGECSVAFGVMGSSVGASSFTNGQQNIASGASSHAEGMSTKSIGRGSHSEGGVTEARSAYSHAEGYGVIAEGNYQSASGLYNVPSPIKYALWEANKEYDVGDIVIHNDTVYECKTANSDSVFRSRYWTYLGGIPTSNYSHIVGNGTDDNARSNAYALTWTGDGKYAGDVYVHANADSGGGTKLATVEDIPNVPVQDVQVNGVSVLADGVANVPIMGINQFGIAKLGNSGVTLDSTGALRTIPAGDSSIKGGTTNYNVIVPRTQHQAVFYGLAKAANDSTQSASSNPVGTYTDDAKAAIQQMLDVPSTDDIPTKVSDLTDDSGHYTKPSTGIPASDLSQAVQASLDKADSALQTAPVQSVNGQTGTVVLDAADVGAGTYSKPSTGIPASDLAAGVIPEVPVQDVQINGVSVLSDGVANVPIASESIVGVVKANANYGTWVQNGILRLAFAGTTHIKQGTYQYLPIAPQRQHESTFYGLAKAAGADMASSSNPVGTYTDEAKAAIRAMFGLDDQSIIDIVQAGLPAAEGVLW